MGDFWNPLVVQAQTGDSRAFATLYTRLSPKLTRYFTVRLAHLPHDVEDLVGEVQLRVWQALPSYQVLDHTFLPWVYTIAFHCWVDYLRKHVTPDGHRRIVGMGAIEARRTHQGVTWEEYLSGWLLAQATCDDGGIEQLPLQLALQQALQALSPTQRQVVELRFFADYQIDKIARIMGKTEPAVKQLLYRTMRILRVSLHEVHTMA